MNLSSKDSVDEPEGEGRGEALKSRLSCSSYSVGRSSGDADPLREQGTMGTFPAYILLEIFSSYMDHARTDEWYRLAQVCQRWRYVVSGSPRRLNLRLLCTNTTPVRDMLDIWPTFPLEIHSPSRSWDHGSGNIITALRYKERIVDISFTNVPSEIWEELVAAMQEPLPALTNLTLWSGFDLSAFSSQVKPLPDSFLGVSAPSLQTLCLNRVPYPALPQFLSSACDLVDLKVLNIRNSWRILPEDLVPSLSSMTRLTFLRLGFESDNYFRPGQVSRRSPDKKRTVLPSLTHFKFYGDMEYSEDLVARIDAPRLREVWANFFKPSISADISQLTQFICQADNAPLLDQADIRISDVTGDEVDVCLSAGTEVDGQLGASRAWFKLIVSCAGGWDGLSTLTQICAGSSFPSSSLPLSTLEHLTISGYRSRWPKWGDRWLEFLPAFTAVKNLYLCEYVAPRLLPVLKGVTGVRIAEVLPALQNLFLEEYKPSNRSTRLQEAVQQFTTVRRLAGRPVAVHDWDRWRGVPEYWRKKSRPNY